MVIERGVPKRLDPKIASLVKRSQNINFIVVDEVPY